MASINPTMCFWLALQGPVADYLQTKVNDWNKTQTEWQVELKNSAGIQNYGQPADVALKTAPQEQPSLVLAPEFMTSKMIEALDQKKVIPVYEILKPEEQDKIAELVRRTFGDAKGRVVSLPFNPACGILYTNKDALKEAGFDPNFVPRTIEELVQVSKEIVAKGVVEQGYTCAWPAAYLLEVPAAMQDIPMAIPDNGFSGFGIYQLSQPWFKKHLMELRRQINEKIFVYAGKDNSAKTPFINKKVAFFMQGSSHAELLKKEAKFNLGYGPIPTLSFGQKEKFAFPLGGASIWVLDNEKTKAMLNGVRAFLTYLASDDVQKELHMQTASVPVSATLTGKLAEFYKDHPLHRAVAEQTVNARLCNHSFGIHMPNYNDARQKLFDLIEKVVDTKNVSERQVEELLIQFDATYSIAQPGLIKQKLE